VRHEGIVKERAPDQASGGIADCGLRIAVSRRDGDAPAAGPTLHFSAICFLFSGFLLRLGNTLLNHWTL
jgi:hypothetical protein